MPNGPGGSVIEQIEKKLGLPPLSKVSEGLQKFPDMPRLQLIRSILETCERLSEKAPQLDKVISLVVVIAETPIDKLDKLEKVLKQANKLMTQAPDQLLDFLSSLKEG